MDYINITQSKPTLLKRGNLAAITPLMFCSGVSRAIVLLWTKEGLPMLVTFFGLDHKKVETVIKSSVSS